MGIDFGSEGDSTFALLDQVIDRRAAGQMTGSYAKPDGRTMRDKRQFMALSSQPPDAPIVGYSRDL